MHGFHHHNGIIDNQADGGRDAARVIKLKPCPMTRSASNVINTVAGITAAAIKVAPQFS